MDLESYTRQVAKTLLLVCWFDHVRKIRDRKQRTYVWKYFFVNGTIKNWNQLPVEALGLFLVNLKFLERELGKQL
jgi:diadenosine tetraphosphate (Ap4A) HIT family hydrolase